MNVKVLDPGDEVDYKLTMKNHAVHLAIKAAKKQTALRRSSHVFDSSGCKRLYEAQVHSSVCSTFPLELPAPHFICDFLTEQRTKQEDSSLN